MRLSFPNYFEKRKQTNLKRLYFPIFIDFFSKKKKKGINEYVNELICIHELKIVRQCLSFGLVPFLSICIDNRLRYDYFTMFFCRFLKKINK